MTASTPTPSTTATGSIAFVHKPATSTNNATQATVREDRNKNMRTTIRHVDERQMSS